MAKAARTVADKEVAMLTKIVLPWIGVVDRLVRDQELVIDPAAIERCLAERSERHAPGLIAVAPVIEGLRVGEGRCFGQRKSDFGIDRVVGPAGMPSHAAAWQEVTRAVVAECWRLGLRAV